MQVDAFGYCGYNPNYDEIVVSFRGSQTLLNWIEDLKFEKEKTPFDGECCLLPATPTVTHLCIS